MTIRPSKLLTRIGAVVGLGLAVSSLPVLAQSGNLSMLAGLTKGEWTIKFRDGSPERKICVRSGRELIQPRYSRANCRRYVVTDSASKVTVRYNCPGGAYDRTDVRRETRGLVQIQSQGIADGRPFSFGAEARRTGSC